MLRRRRDGAGCCGISGGVATLNAEQIATRLAKLSTDLFQVALQVQGLHDQVDDYIADCEACAPVDMQGGCAAGIADALKCLRTISSTLAQIDSSLHGATLAAQRPSVRMDQASLISAATSRTGRVIRRLNNG